MGKRSERQIVNKNIELRFADQDVSEDGLTFSGVAINLETKNNSHKALFRKTAFKVGGHKVVALYAHNQHDDKKVIGQAVLTVDSTNAVKFEATLMPELDDTDSKTVARTAKMLKAGILDSVSIGVSYSDYKYHWDRENWKNSYLEVKQARFTELSVVHAGSDPNAKVKKVNFSLDEAQFLFEQEQQFKEDPEDDESQDEFEVNQKNEANTEDLKMGVENVEPTQSINNLDTYAGLSAELSDHRKVIAQARLDIKEKKEGFKKNQKNLTIEEQKEFKREVEEMTVELSTLMLREDSLKSQISLLDEKQKDIFEVLDIDDKEEESAELEVLKATFADAWVNRGSRFAVTVAPESVTSAFMSEIIEAAFENGSILQTVKKVSGKAVINSYNVFLTNHAGGKGEYKSKISTEVVSTLDTISLAYARYKAATLIDHEVRNGTGIDLYKLLVRTISESLIKLLEKDWVHGASTNAKLGDMPDGLRGVATSWAVDNKLSKIVTFKPDDNILDNMLVNLSEVKGRKKGEKVNAFMSEFTYLKMLRQGGPVTNESLWTKLMDKFNFVETPEMLEDIGTTPTGAPYVVLGVNQAYHVAFENGKQIAIGETPQDEDLESKLFGHTFASGLPTEQYSFVVITDGDFVETPTSSGLSTEGKPKKNGKNNE